MNKKTMAATLALLMALSINGTVLAAPTTSTQSRQQVEAKIEKLDTQISNVTDDITENEDKIKKLNNDIAKVQNEIKVSENKIADEQEVFNKRVRAMYMSGADSYVGVLLESEGLGDFIERVESIKTIISYDLNIMDKLKTEQEALEVKKTALKAENEKVIVAKAENQQKLSALNKNKKDLDKLLVSLGSYSSGGTSKAVAASLNNITSIRNSTKSYVPSRGAASVSTNAVVAYASNFLGTPYRWAANGPNAFDCSGFTSYVFRHFGISLPRTSSSQQSVGVAVSRSELRPGDLVFFGSPAHHVGIYVGNGCYIHAPRTGDVVKVSPLDRSDYSGARRVF
ncbi:MAG: NlpC/P60 family protein [Clostridiaceae bacterium]